MMQVWLVPEGHMCFLLLVSRLDLSMYPILIFAHTWFDAREAAQKMGIPFGDAGDPEFRNWRLLGREEESTVEGKLAILHKTKTRHVEALEVSGGTSSAANFRRPKSVRERKSVAHKKRHTVSEVLDRMQAHGQPAVRIEERDPPEAPTGVFPKREDSFAAARVRRVARG